jgi:hypothetical protein
MNAKPRRPDPKTGAHVCKSGFIMKALVAAFGCIMAAAPLSATELLASNLSGRWTQMVADSKHPCANAGCRLAYDFVRCGDAWCGIEVKDGKDCGRTALHLDPSSVNPFAVEFFGRYEKAEGMQPYAVAAYLHLNSQQNLPKDQLLLSVRGNTGGTFEAFRRTFPLNMVLLREGEPQCQLGPKLS